MSLKTFVSMERLGQTLGLLLQNYHDPNNGLLYMYVLINLFKDMLVCLYLNTCTLAKFNL